MKQPPQVFYKKAAIKKLAIFIGKHLRMSASGKNIFGSICREECQCESFVYHTSFGQFLEPFRCGLAEFSLICCVYDRDEIFLI